MSQQIRKRAFMITSFNEENYNSWKEISLDKIKYLVYQLEQCPKTKKNHVQGYVEFKNQRRSYDSIKDFFSDSSLHIEPRMGTPQQAHAYCTKEDSRIKDPIIMGTPLSQGKRSDLDCIYSDIKSGKDLNWIIEKYPSSYIKYSRGIEKVYFNHLSSSLGSWNQEISVKVIYGDAGTGKTRYVYDHHDPKDVYCLNKSNSNNIWFDGYDGQKVLILDDFYGWIPYGFLLQLLDKRRIRLEKKGGFTISQWTDVYITSNDHPEDWYQRGYTDALKRRIEKVMKFVSEKVQISSPPEEVYVSGSIVLPTTSESTDSEKSDSSSDEFKIKSKFKKIKSRKMSGGVRIKMSSPVLKTLKARRRVSPSRKGSAACPNKSSLRGSGTKGSQPDAARIVVTRHV